MIQSTDFAQVRSRKEWMDSWYLHLEESERKFLVAELAREHVLRAAVFPKGAAGSAGSREERTQSKAERWRAHPRASHFLASQMPLDPLMWCSGPEALWTTSSLGEVPFQSGFLWPETRRTLTNTPVLYLGHLQRLHSHTAKAAGWA